MTCVLTRLENSKIVFRQGSSQDPVRNLRSLGRLESLPLPHSLSRRRLWRLDPRRLLPTRRLQRLGFNDGHAPHKTPFALPSHVLDSGAAALRWLLHPRPTL